jgi:resuscitation-promoting factor RpfA
MRHARYRGHHRKPSNTGRLTAIGAVGAGTIAATILTPTAAHAATDVQWDRVAHCESGDNWHDNTGNGYYGGLQFSSSTWSSYDVDGFAHRADLASREQQITVANRVLNNQGWGAWPVCSHYAGAPGPSHSHKGSGARHAKRAKHHEAATEHGGWRHYRVKRGDTLAEIAHRHEVKGGWHALYRHNRAVIGDNPSVIHAGITLKFQVRAHHS